MPTRYATDEEIQKWNEYINANPGGGNILQGKEFLQQKADAGWKIRYLFVDDIAIGAMEKTVPLLGKIWYLPKGPDATSKTDLLRTLEELRPFAKKPEYLASR